MSRTTRAAALAALLGLVLSFLVCGAPASPSPGDAPVVAGAAVPGCDPGHPGDEGAAGPGVPPRAHGFAELLPALATDRVPPAVRRPDAAGPVARQGREPPARVRTPVELSVLRV
ncbi:hypothetical protein ABZ926_28470 [Streptomyces litmocidini]|uniref:hypothetical protein n=1 Tax=Streptomyces TaxID=1883 RepID=UPI000F4A0740|nr:hypothetical protein [Streptomyces sp. PanSC19]ROQ33289.1 hypothetical protein EDD98_2304 [Streptomyces sp. PanSC19]